MAIKTTGKVGRNRFICLVIERASSKNKLPLKRVPIANIKTTLNTV